MARKESTIEEEPKTHKHQEPEHRPSHGSGSAQETTHEHEHHRGEQASSEAHDAATPSTAEQTDQPLVTPYASLPPLLGHAPTSFRQMMSNLPGTKATHITGPLVSGPVPGSPLVAGAAPLALTLMLDYTMGNFNLVLPFPPGSFIYSWMSIAFTGFNASPGPVAFGLGSQSGLTDIFSGGSFGSAGGEIDQNITGSLPLWNAVSPLVPFQAWLNVSGMAGATAGQGLIVLFYFRLPQAWS